MDLSARLTELAKIKSTATPVVSVYLNTRWADEHQRDRVRVFLKNQIRKARESQAGLASYADLDWVQREGDALVSQARFPEAHGAALFACEALGLRVVIPVRVPFEDAFVVAEVPFLRPLARALEEAPVALVAFLDTESARLIPFMASLASEEVILESEVPGHHRRGGWAQMAQSRYQRHIQDHRSRHFDAVTESLVGLAESHGVERIVLAGEPRNVAVFKEGLPPRIAQLVAGAVSGARHESAAVLVSRAAKLLAILDGQRRAAEVDAVLTEAAKGGQAAAGLDQALEAVNRGAVHRLYLLKGFDEPGRGCGGCGALQRGPGAICRFCGKETKPAELGEAMADRVMASEGTVETVDIHQALERAGGVAAGLRYPL